MLHDDYLYLVESYKQRIEEVRSKIQAENLETRATSKRVRILPPSLSRDRRINMKKSNQSKKVKGGELFVQDTQ